jgi:hypothetical protein
LVSPNLHWLCGDGDTELEIFRLAIPFSLAIGHCGQEPSSDHPVRLFSPRNDAPSATPHKEIYSSALDSESVGFINNTQLVYSSSWPIYQSITVASFELVSFFISAVDFRISILGTWSRISGKYNGSEDLWALLATIENQLLSSFCTRSQLSTDD